MLEHLSFFSRRILVLVSVLSLLGGCADPESGGTSDAVESPEPSGAPTRIVAIGDLHGDLDAARAALRLAGAIDAQDRWIGLIQTMRPRQWVKNFIVFAVLVFSMNLLDFSLFARTCLGFMFFCIILNKYYCQLYHSVPYIK